MINISELKNKSIEDLKKDLEKSRKDLQKTVSEILQKKEKNVKKALIIRKDIARMKTFLNQKLKEEQK